MLVFKTFTVMPLFSTVFPFKNKKELRDESVLNKLKKQTKSESFSSGSEPETSLSQSIRGG